MTEVSQQGEVFNNRVVNRAVLFMKETYQNKVDLDGIADHVGRSKYELCRVFRRSLLISPMRFLWLFRVMIATELMKAFHHKPLSEIALETGFNSPAHFSRAFRKIHGITPKELRMKIYLEKVQQSQGNTEPSQGQDMVMDALNKAVGMLRKFADGENLIL